jgi:hypothetical protein
MAVMIACAPVLAEEESRFEGKVKTVSVFKNGYGFFRMEGDVEVKDGRAEISPVPSASLGTWWFYSPREGVTVEQVVAGKREISETRKATKLASLVRANVGRAASVETERGEYRGLIIAGPGDHPVQEGKPWDIILKVDADLVSVQGLDVKSIRIDGGTDEYPHKMTEGFLALELSGAPDGKVPVGCQFLQKGIRWIPSYRLELTDEENAALLLQAEVINDIHDLDSTTLELVVGVPRFIVGEQLSPLAYVGRRPHLSDFFKLTAKGEPERVAFSNYASPARRYAGMTRDRSIFGVDRTMDSRNVSDLFFYTKEGVSLKVGERASLGILRASLPYSDIYKWEVADRMIKHRGDYRDIYSRWVNGEFEYKRDLPEELSQRLEELTRIDAAEHFVRLTNTTDKPLTSGPVLLFSRGDVLAQGVVTYTPAGGTTDVRVTGAPDITVKQREEETARVHAALTSYGNRYDRVEVRTLLTVTNFKSKTIHMVVSKSFDGKVSRRPESASVTQDTAELASVNPHTRVEWEFDLEPDGEKELSLTYSTHVREE